MFLQIERDGKLMSMERAERVDWMLHANTKAGGCNLYLRIAFADNTEIDVMTFVDMVRLLAGHNGDFSALIKTLKLTPDQVECWKHEVDKIEHKLKRDRGAAPDQNDLMKPWGDLTQK
jgi:hypothetical protein